ncbi:hypothetical protein Scep_021230 [Stephania cephalantha]|uniref:Uncharacterized protein n=1 Tax=Stephania cephalantha TaxID=152367 RepID=A0AAP0I190_9MAGN
MACDGSSSCELLCTIIKQSYQAPSYELLYAVVKQSYQAYITNGTLVALDDVFAFDIQKPMGGFVEWHMLTFNHIRILEELDIIKKSLHIPPSQSPYQLLYRAIKPSYQAYYSNGSLAALDKISAFYIQKPMGDFKEWHILTFNQIRILEEVNEIKKALHVKCPSQSPYEVLYPIVKQNHQIYLNNGSLAALDDIFAFDIQKPMGDFKEWRMVTFNQIRILEELNGCISSCACKESPYKLYYPIVKRDHQIYLTNGTLVALDEDFAFDIQKPMGGFTEWHMITFNQIRIIEQMNEVKKKYCLHL